MMIYTLMEKNGMHTFIPTRVFLANINTNIIIRITLIVLLSVLLVVLISPILIQPTRSITWVVVTSKPPRRPGKALKLDAACVLHGDVKSLEAKRAAFPSG